MLHFGLSGTLGDLEREHDCLHSYCMNPRCSYLQRIDTHILVLRLGNDHPALRERILPKIVCDVCGSPALGIAPPANPGDGKAE